MGQIPFVCPQNLQKADVNTLVMREGGLNKFDISTGFIVFHIIRSFWQSLDSCQSAFSRLPWPSLLRPYPYIPFSHSCSDNLDLKTLTTEGAKSANFTPWHRFEDRYKFACELAMYNAYDSQQWQSALRRMANLLSCLKRQSSSNGELNQWEQAISAREQCCPCHECWERYSRCF